MGIRGAKPFLRAARHRGDFLVRAANLFRIDRRRAAAQGAVRRFG